MTIILIFFLYSLCLYFGELFAVETLSLSVAAILPHIGLIIHINLFCPHILFKYTSTTVVARIRTHIVMTRPSKHKSDALNCSPMALHAVGSFSSYAFICTVLSWMSLYWMTFPVLTFPAKSFYSFYIVTNIYEFIELKCIQEPPFHLPRRKVNKYQIYF